MDIPDLIVCGEVWKPEYREKEDETRTVHTALWKSPSSAHVVAISATEYNWDTESPVTLKRRREQRLERLRLSAAEFVAKVASDADAQKDISEGRYNLPI